jgi:hypothetical protein
MVEMWASMGLTLDVGVLPAVDGWSNFGRGRGSSESSQGDTGSLVRVRGGSGGAVGGICWEDSWLSAGVRKASDALATRVAKRMSVESNNRSGGW